MSFECISRADRLNEEVLKSLKNAGCFRIWIGAESGSQKVLDAMDRRVKVEQVHNMIQTVKSVNPDRKIRLSHSRKSEVGNSRATNNRWRKNR